MTHKFVMKLEKEQLEVIHNTILMMVSASIFGKPFDDTTAEGRILKEWYEEIYKPTIEIQLREEHD